jgi:phosphatidate phosphatase APP1
MSRIARGQRGVRPETPLVCRWDLDKTYLRSEFETIRQLLRTAFERGEDKVDVPGVVELIKVIREAADRRRRPCRTLFVSASPPQIGKAIRQKLDLDGVPYDGIVFKNQLQHLRPGKLRNLREHVGFKLVALLRGRLEESPETR